jgi:hypothetical protein
MVGDAGGDVHGDRRGDAGADAPYASDSSSRAGGAGGSSGAVSSGSSSSSLTAPNAPSSSSLATTACWGSASTAGAAGVPSPPSSSAHSCEKASDCCRHSSGVRPSPSCRRAQHARKRTSGESMPSFACASQLHAQQERTRASGSAANSSRLFTTSACPPSAALRRPRQGVSTCICSAAAAVNN